MIWNAPSWSPASVQYTHGFPRRLIAESHGGFLPGNIIVSAKASNLCLRRLSVCDVASLVSRLSVSGVGLSYARLLNLRYAAIRYHHRSYTPDYLVRGMLDFGLNFATFLPIDVVALEALKNSLKSSWSPEEGTVEQEDEDGDDGQAEEGSKFTEPAILTQIGKATTPRKAGEEDDAALTTLLSHAVDGEIDRSEDCSSDDEARNAGQQRNAQILRVAKKRKRKSKSSSGGKSKHVKRTNHTADSTANDVDEAGTCLPFQCSVATYFLLI